jgi:DNA gyrase/topoisomerase IV subunit A
VLNIDKTDTIAAMLPVSDFNAEEVSLVLLSGQGKILRTPLNKFSKINSLGLAAMKLVVSRFTDAAHSFNPSFFDSLQCILLVVRREIRCVSWVCALIQTVS